MCSLCLLVGVSFLPDIAALLTWIIYNTGRAFRDTQTLLTMYTESFYAQILPQFKVAAMFARIPLGFGSQGTAMVRTGRGPSHGHRKCGRCMGHHGAVCLPHDIPSPRNCLVCCLADHGGGCESFLEQSNRVLMRMPRNDGRWVTVSSSLGSLRALARSRCSDIKYNPCQDLLWARKKDDQAEAVAG